MRNHIPLKWTAAFVTVLVLGVIFLLLGSQSAPDPSKKTGELAVGLRPLAVQWSGLEQASRELEKAEPPGDRETMREMIKNQVQGPIRALFLSSRSPGTDSSYKLGAGMAVAFGEETMAREILERIREPDEESSALARLLACGGSPTEVEKLLPSFSPEPLRAICSESLSTAAFEGKTTGLLPSTVRMRLEAQSARLNGDHARAEEVDSRRVQREEERVSQVGQAYMIPVSAGGLGLLLLLFHRRIRQRLTRYPGMRERSLFPTDGVRLYLVLIGWFGFSLAFSILSQPQGPLGFLAQSPGVSLVVTALASGLFSIYLIQQVAPHKRGSIWDAFGLHIRGFEKRIWVLLALGILGYCAAVPLTASASAFTQLVTGETPVMTHPIIWMLAEAESSSMIVLLVLGACVIAPFFEEILFRGYLFQVLRERVGGTLSILVSSLIFAALHPSPFTILPLFSLACILCLLYARTGSLWPSVILHALHNGVSVFLVLTTMAP